MYYMDTLSLQVFVIGVTYCSTKHDESNPRAELFQGSYHCPENGVHGGL